MAIVSGRENNHSPTMGALAIFAAQILRLTLPSLPAFVTELGLRGGKQQALMHRTPLMIRMRDFRLPVIDLS